MKIIKLVRIGKKNRLSIKLIGNSMYKVFLEKRKFFHWEDITQTLEYATPIFGTEIEAVVHLHDTICRIHGPLHFKENDIVFLIIKNQIVCDRVKETILSIDGVSMKLKKTKGTFHHSQIKRKDSLLSQINNIESITASEMWKENEEKWRRSLVTIIPRNPIT